VTVYGTTQGVRGRDAPIGRRLDARLERNADPSARRSRRCRVSLGVRQGKARSTCSSTRPTSSPASAAGGRSDLPMARSAPTTTRWGRQTMIHRGRWVAIQESPCSQTRFFPAGLGWTAGPALTSSQNRGQQRARRGAVYGAVPRRAGEDVRHRLLLRAVVLELLWAPTQLTRDPARCTDVLNQFSAHLRDVWSRTRPALCDGRPTRARIGRLSLAHAAAVLLPADGHLATGQTNRQGLFKAVLDHNVTPMQTLISG